VGLAFSFGTIPVVLNGAGWVQPGDVWRSFEGGLWTVWGDFPQALHYVSAPGTAILMAPPALVTYHLHLVAAWPFPLRQPGAWLVLDPYMLVVGSTVVFAADHLARRLGIPAGRRTALAWMTALMAAPVTILWGHPEDVVAMALGLGGVAAAADGRWGRTGWLFGLGTVLQPLVLLLLLPVLALTAPRVWVRVLVRAAVPTAAVMAIPLISTGGDAARFMSEPIYVHPNFATPLGGHPPAPGPARGAAPPDRAAARGPAANRGRGAGRRGADPLQVTWYGGLAMALRFLLEPVLTPYYLWPAVTLLLVVIAYRSAWWALVPLVAASTYSYFHREEWLYWMPLVGMVGLALVITGRAVLVPGSDVAAAGTRAPAPSGTPQPTEPPEPPEPSEAPVLAD
jgi:hypothetical protein